MGEKYNIVFRSSSASLALNFGIPGVSTATQQTVAVSSVTVKLILADFRRTSLDGTQNHHLDENKCKGSTVVAALLQYVHTFSSSSVYFCCYRGHWFIQTLLSTPQTEREKRAKEEARKREMCE